ncbi:unnamed protein product [Dracunculus medinensis]|uniref:long-chain-fatty-acid--CoA ligase n=1 Tax=Dracunculus medinensis TaxID=318479 RepID=A0A3P7QT52_DRAME|nr:unnamed protein product [Dracunculus medinensis]
MADKQTRFDQIPPDIDTLYKVFLNGLRVSGDGPCIWHRSSIRHLYRPIKYSDVLERNIKNDFIGNETRVGIYSKNCPEWFITTLACIQHSIVIVPLYDTLGHEAIKFILEQCELNTVVVSDSENAKKLLSANISFLENIILIDRTNIDELITEGNEYHIKMMLPKPEDIYIICYTSGTTSIPKGVILTHQNFIANIAATHLLALTFFPDLISPNEVEISYLPLPHVVEQITHWCMFLIGSSVGYMTGNVQGLMTDMKDLRPTVFPAVPRILNRIYDQIQETVKNKNFIARALFNFAYQRKLSLVKQGIITNDTIWDWIIFSKIQKSLGGRVRLLSIGAAAIDAKVVEACRVIFGSVIVETYGLTECMLVTSSWPNDTKSVHGGAPAGCTLLKLIDVPELNYYSNEGKGEIMVKGPHVTKGYFKDPEKTAQLFDDQGFLHTGDIGQILPNGSIQIIDRKKHIFKLAQGEYIAPEKIENIYLRAPCVQQIFVDGNPLERWLFLFFFIKVKEYVLNELQKVGIQNNLNSLEKVKAIHLTNEAFSVENGLLTPTMKGKRPQLRKHYQDIINNLYKTMDSNNDPKK